MTLKRKKVARNRGKVNMAKLLEPEPARKARVFGKVKPKVEAVYWPAPGEEPYSPPAPEAILRQAAPSRYGGPVSPPFAGGRPHRKTLPSYLDHAAYYLAAVLCEMNGHQHDQYDRKDAWPCTRSLAFAMQALHKLAEHKLEGAST